MRVPLPQHMPTKTFVFLPHFLFTGLFFIYKYVFIIFPVDLLQVEIFSAYFIVGVKDIECHEIVLRFFTYNLAFYQDFVFIIVCLHLSIFCSDAV